MDTKYGAWVFTHEPFDGITITSGETLSFVTHVSNYFETKLKNKEFKYSYGYIKSFCIKSEIKVVNGIEVLECRVDIAYSDIPRSTINDPIR